MAKYSELTLGQIEAIVNKLGGMEGVKTFLAGESTVIGASSEPKEERTMFLTDGDPRFAEQLRQGAEVLKLGKVWYTHELHAMINVINQKQVRIGESTWRLPTKAELLASHRAKDGKFGHWMTWSGDVDNTAPNCLWIVNLKDGDTFGDSSGSQVEAYLIKTGISRK